MLLSEDLLIKLENAHHGRLSVKDMAALDATFASDPHLMADAKVYQRLWQGFDALKGQKQTHLYQEWEQDWLNHDETELIEWYVNDELGEANTKRLNDKCNTNSDFAAKVASFKAIQGGFDSLKSENFKAKMTNWQNLSQEQKIEIKKPRSLGISWKRKLAIAASLLLLISSTFSWWSHDQVSNPSLAASHYLAPAVGNNLSGETSIGAYLNSYAQAHLFMKAENYPKAIEIFQLLKNQELPQEWPESERKHYFENVEWNLLLALLGDGQTERSFTNDLEKIANDTVHEYNGNAKELMLKMDSFWRF